MGISQKLRKEKNELIAACAEAQAWLDELEKGSRGGEASALLVDWIRQGIGIWTARNMEIDKVAVGKE